MGKILEDDAFVRMSSVEGSKDLGYEVLEASNADEAILFLENHRDVRLIFTDVNMPGLDGLRLAHAVAHRWPPAKIVVTSGRPLEGELPEGARFYSKPYAVAEMHRAFQSMLG